MKWLRVLNVASLAGLCICLASILTFGIVPLCSIDSVLRGYVSGYLALGDLAKWEGVSSLNMLTTSLTVLTAIALAVFVHHLRTGSGLSLALSGSLSLSLVTFSIPLMRMAHLVVTSVTSICSQKFAISVDYGYVVYVGPNTCHVYSAAAFSLLSFFIASIGASAGVLIKWFEYVSKR